MKASDLKNYIISLFEEIKIGVEGESGFLIDDSNEIKKIGYATNLTPETIQHAIDQDVDVIITHHDAWKFVFGMKDYCIEKLKEHGISHFFIHLPLDDCDFGTNVSFFNKLGVKIIEKTNLQEAYFYCGRIGEFKTPIEFYDLISKVEGILEEKVKGWKNNDRKVKRVGFISGAGFLTSDMKEMVDKNCDVFITGEKILYTIQYAEFCGMNLIVGSHTYTEIFGVETLCQKIKEQYNEIEIIRLIEEHKE